MAPISVSKNLSTSNAVNQGSLLIAPLWEKVRTVAREIYGADDIIGQQKVRDRFREFESQGFGHFPVCVAKTQYGFTTDPRKLGAPMHHVAPVREVRLSAGAEFLVVVCGDIMMMTPGTYCKSDRLRGRRSDDGALLADGNERSGDGIELTLLGAFIEEAQLIGSGGNLQPRPIDASWADDGAFFLQRPHVVEPGV